MASFTAAPGVVPRTENSYAAPVAPRPPAAPTGAAYYSRLLGNDQILRQQLQGYNTQGNAAQSQRDLGDQGLIAQSGYTPSAGLLQANRGTIGDISGLLNPETRGLAQAANVSGVSALAQTQHAYGQANAVDAAHAAARGLGHSGLVGQYMNENLGGYQRNQYADQSALLAALGKGQQDYLSTQRDLQGQAGDATNQALARYIAMIQAGQIAAPAAAARSVTGLPGVVSGSGVVPQVVRGRVAY